MRSGQSLGSLGPVPWAFIALFVTLFSLSCNRSRGLESSSLIAGKTPVASEGIRNADRLTDGVAATEGDHWETDLTVPFDWRRGSVEYDLGAPTKIAAIFLQGDNNDRFEVAVAGESKEWRRVWTAETVPGAGMRARHKTGLDEVARYVRISARGGDPGVSVSEIQIFSQTPEPWPPEVSTRVGARAGSEANRPLIWFTVAAALALLLHRKTWHWTVLVALAAATAALLVFALKVVYAMWPVREPQINLLRAVAATVGLAAVARIALRPADRLGAFVTGHLAAMALLAVATFYNLGHPQFINAAEKGHTYVHTWDMRVYYPTAKYFDELGFDGLYVGSVKAYAEDVPNSLPNRLANVDLRDLRTYRMARVRDVMDEVEAVKHRFTPERWEAFRRDMAYFRETMGSGGYLGSLRDHGGNATPAWLLVANGLFRWTTANEVTLLAAAALDPLLLLLFFAVAWRTFGLTTALVCIVIYGTTAFPMFGSNWGGSTLRNDWMVLLGLGACALKSRWWFTGGVLLASGAMIRAFPAFAVFTLPIPALFWVFEHFRDKKKLPSLREIRERQAPLLRTMAGVLTCVATLFVASGLAFGFKESWGSWAQKISMHSVKPNVNHVGLRTVVAYDSDKTLAALHRSGEGDWSQEQVRTLRRRMPLYVLAIAIYSALAVAACRRRSLEAAALIGLMMIPIWLYPSNYYLHYVFVLPLLAELREERHKRWFWGFACTVLLAMSIAHYFGFDTVETDQRYAVWSYPVLIGYALILAAMAAESLGLYPRRLEQPSAPPLTAPESAL